MSAKQDKLISEQQTYLDMVTAAHPYRRVSMYDRINARSELDRLREDLQFSRAANVALDSEISSLRATVEAQARQLEAMKYIINWLKGRYDYDESVLVGDVIHRLEAIAPQAQPAQPMTAFKSGTVGQALDALRG